MSVLDDVLDHIDADLTNGLGRLFDLLRIASISTDPAYQDSCREAANWLACALSEMGIEASVRPTSGHPIVVGHDRGLDRRPHVLFYGHYDVQPVDPIDLWNSPPFEPVLNQRSDGTKFITARGACDDKGQLMTFVEACRAWKLVAGSLPVSVSILFEGEEESGSASLAPFLEANAEELRADLALVCDTGMWSRTRPAIFTALRGLVAQEVVLTAANRDLHSGVFGSAARNPLHVLVRILAALHDANGRVTLPGFYDGVAELPADIRAQWADLEFDAAEFLRGIGLSIPAGEVDRSVFEQTRSRPTCEINGIAGGYSGAGFKTVIPATASAKVSFRLVGDQDPQRVVMSFQSFVKARVPVDCSVDFIPHGASPALEIRHDGPHLAEARKALHSEWSSDPALVSGGGSIPVVGEFKRILGLDTLMIGFALRDDAIHSPNEKYELSSFRGGIRSWARILAALAEARV